MKKRWITLLLPALILLLELLPWGVALNFARAPEEGAAVRIRQLYSCFDLTPFDYANFAPLALGLRFMTVVGGLITVSLLSGAIALHRVNRKLP